MQRYFVRLAYQGTNYHGWQIQPSGNSVQEELIKAFSRILREDINITGAGRTDTGVHASMMIAHFETDKQFNISSLVKNLNSLLPLDIAVFDIWPVDENMHARFSAKSRTYEYYINLDKNPFKNNLSTRIIGKLDIDLMNEAAERLLSYTDFTSFSKTHTDTKTNICHISMAKWTPINQSEWVFTIKADRFLRNMVRAIVGTLFEVGRKKISVEDFCKIIEKKDRCSAGTSAPSQGLFLSNIEY